jgi:hypothetical protein
MPCSTRIRWAAWARRATSWAAATAGGTDSWFLRRGRARRDRRTGGLSAQALVAGVGDQGDAGPPTCSAANLTKHDITELTALVKTRLKRMQYRPGLLVGSLASTGLDLAPFPQLPPLKVVTLP